MILRAAIIALAALGALLTACSSWAASPEDSSYSGVVAAPSALFIPTYWKLSELRGKPVKQTADARSSPSLTFERKDSRVFGFAGCNRFTGTFEFATGNRLRFSNVAATRMACPDMSVESDFMMVLSTVDSYYLDGEALVLNRTRMAPLARFEAVHAPQQ